MSRINFLSGIFLFKGGITYMETKKRIIALVPCGRMVEYEGMTSITNFLMNAVGSGEYNVSFLSVCGYPHAVARNNLFKEAYECIKRDKVDYVLWIDSDHFFTFDHVKTLIKSMDSFNLDSVSAGYYTRAYPPQLCALMVNECKELNL
jgi:hypothetical protein